MRNGFKLGRKAVIYDSRTLRLKKYFTSALPATATNAGPDQGNHSLRECSVTIVYGDCTCAGVGHQVQLWSANIGAGSQYHQPRSSGRV